METLSALLAFAEERRMNRYVTQLISLQNKCLDSQMFNYAMKTHTEYYVLLGPTVQLVSATVVNNEQTLEEAS